MFEKVGYMGQTGGALVVNIRMGGQIYLSGALVSAFPITNEHRTVDFYFDKEASLLAMLPLKETTGHFRITMSGTGKHISCSRFLDTYHIERNQRCFCTIKNVDGKRMIIYPVEFNENKKGQDDGTT